MVSTACNNPGIPIALTLDAEDSLHNSDFKQLTMHIDVKNHLGCVHVTTKHGIFILAIPPKKLAFLINQLQIPFDARDQRLGTP